ncbi:glycosyltransferase [Dyadobacter subterraneus]|uniref:Glycosyltransferase n=1 Tax=Dyadobacter subterraneus TaxID=2773304 RepID=A0ABR9WCB8_9BACT|nr:glycosyltransferase [Dyadobacter subterraneus]MBE9463122.1 glycosyltransferase [Dyadobacter subterraneus]
MKLNGQQIIIFGLPRLDSEIESTNYTTARLLAENNTVYYVENPYTLKDYFRLKGTAQHGRRKKYFSLFNTNVIASETPGLSIVVPPVVFSINFLPEGTIFRLALKVNEFLIAYKIKRIVSKFKIRDFIFINSFNFHYPNIGPKLSPILEVYHCLDPLILPFDSRHGIVSEEILIRNSDVVLCSSKQLYTEKIGQNPHTFFVPNAADLSHSSKALNADLPISDLISTIKKPVIGYFGAIERRMDYILLEEVIKQNPDKNFVFVGPVSKEYVPDTFFSFSNVKFIGSVPYEAMPSIIKGFDVALIPFKKDEVSRTIFPLKLFEYLGAGKPVVATDFNLDLKDFTGNSVAYCDNAATFSNAIDHALLNSGADKISERIAIAANNTWEKRVNEMAEIMNNRILQKQSGR